MNVLPQGRKEVRFSLNWELNLDGEKAGQRYTPWGSFVYLDLLGSAPQGGAGRIDERGRVRARGHSKCVVWLLALLLVSKEPPAGRNLGRSRYDVGGLGGRDRRSGDLRYILCRRGHRDTLEGHTKRP